MKSIKWEFNQYLINIPLDRNRLLIIARSYFSRYPRMICPIWDRLSARGEESERNQGLYRTLPFVLRISTTLISEHDSELYI